MKKVLTAVFAVVAAAVVLTACSKDADNASQAEFSKAALVASSDIQNVEFPYNARTTITENQLASTPFGGGDAITYNGEFTFNGVALGDDLQSFIDKLSIADEKAMFETSLVLKEDEILFNYPAYTQEDFEELKSDDYDDFFLTVGYCTAAGSDSAEWDVMNYDDLYRTWNMELQPYRMSEIGDICLISAGVDEEGKINMIDVYYGSLASYYENENYKVDVDYFAAEESTESSVEE